MYRIVEGNTHGLADAEDFVRMLQELGNSPVPEARTLFAGGAELLVARAPGRLDLMGGIADYSGSLVLQMPIREATMAAVEPIEKREIRIVSLPCGTDLRPPRTLHLALEELEAGGRPIEYSEARKRFERRLEDRWAAYVAGVILVLMREKSAPFRSGLRLLIDSRVPEGKGVSSSAALEVAVMTAVAAAQNLKLAAREIALLCQKVENLVAGAPCGVMDQMTAACGKENRLLALLCQPAKLQGFLIIPEEIAVTGIDSGVRHAVTGAAYGDVRAGAFVGYRMIADITKLPVAAGAKDGLVQIDDPRWGGYLANITPSEFERRFMASLPEDIAGAEFLAAYGGTTDEVTRIHPEKKYSVRTPTAHPIYENSRVRAFQELLRDHPDNSHFRQLGELMYQSHASYSACGLGEARTDLLVDLSRRRGPASGVFGAKITGGGSGGTVAFLTLRKEDAGECIAAEFARMTGETPHIFSGSSPGAAEFGILRLRKVS
jgi:L-arabinokinase